MRRRFFHILLILTALAIANRLSAQEALFDKYEDAQGVTTIYISKTMLRMMRHPFFILSAPP